MTRLRITAGPHVFIARLEEQAAPKTCAAFLGLLPYRQKLIHARWSGEACWIPLGEFRLGVAAERALTHPAPGQLLYYPGGTSEAEIFFPYAKSAFACKEGPLAGSPFLTVVDGQERLASLGTLTLWKGAQEISFERIP